MFENLKQLIHRSSYRYEKFPIAVLELSSNLRPRIWVVCFLFRILKPNGRAVLLTGESLKQFLLDCVKDHCGLAPLPCSPTANRASVKQALSVNGKPMDSKHTRDSKMSESASGDAVRENVEVEQCIKKRIIENSQSLCHGQKELCGMDCHMCTGSQEHTGQTSWHNKGNHYMKLGETHGCVCVFVKEYSLGSALMWNSFNNEIV